MSKNEKYARAQKRIEKRQKQIEEIEPELTKLQEQVEDLQSKIRKDQNSPVKDYVQYLRKNGIRDWPWLLAHDHEISRHDPGERFNLATQTLHTRGIYTSGFFPATSQFHLMLTPRICKNAFKDFDEILRTLKEIEPHLIKFDRFEGLAPVCYPVSIGFSSGSGCSPYLLFCEDGTYQVIEASMSRYRKEVESSQEFKQLKRALKYVFEEYSEDY